MKVLLYFVLVAFALGFAGTAYADANSLAKGVDQVTHAPLAGLMTVSEHLFTPVKEVNGGALDVTDKARGWAVSVGLNGGQPVE